NILREILRHAAADHEDAGRRVLNLQLRQLVKILAAIPRNVRLAFARMQVMDQSKAGRAIAERGAEDRHILLIRLVQNRIRTLRPAILVEISAELLEKLARAVVAGLEAIEDSLGGLIADAQIFLVDERVVDAVNRHFA